MLICFVIELRCILHNKAETILLHLGVKYAVSIRIANIRHISDEGRKLSPVFILDQVACNFLTGRSIIIGCIFVNIIALLAIINNLRFIRIINQVDGHERRGAIIRESLRFTIIRSLRPNLILILRFKIQRTRLQVDLTIFNLEGSSVIGAGLIIRKGIREFAPRIFILGNNRANEFTNRSVLMYLKYIFRLFISRSIVYIVNLNRNIDIRSKCWITTIGCNNANRIFLLHFIVQDTVLSNLDHTSCFINLKRLIVIDISIRSCKCVRRLLASNTITLAIIIASHYKANRSIFFGIFINS